MQIKTMEKWVWATLESGLNQKYTYHNEFHISGVIRDLEKIIEHYDISAHDKMLLKTAALFHDLAFVNTHENHEAQSAEMAREKLPEFGYNQDDIETIASMILATKLPQSPKTFLEKILCDADLFYLGGDDYFEIADGLKREWENIGFLKSEEQWLEAQLNFLKNHSYHTNYAQHHLTPAKEAIIKELERQKRALRN